MVFVSVLLCGQCLAFGVISLKKAQSSSPHCALLRPAADLPNFHSRLSTQTFPPRFVLLRNCGYVVTTLMQYRDNEYNCQLPLSSFPL